VRRVNIYPKKFMTTKLSCLQQNQALNWPIGKVRLMGGIQPIRSASACMTRIAISISWDVT
jgi:hypothetical protein